MQEDAVVSVVADTRARQEILEQGFTRHPLRVDVDVARALSELTQAAWSLPKDQYYEGGDRFRSLNRFRAEIVEGGVRVWPCDETQPYVQLEKYNTTLGGQPRRVRSAAQGNHRNRRGSQDDRLPPCVLALSTVGATYAVNMHVIRFAATPSQPCDTSPPGLHKDGEKYLATHLLARCGAQGGEVVITDNDKREMDRFTMRECGECYVFDDDRIWHMLTPVRTLAAISSHIATRSHSTCCRMPGNRRAEAPGGAR